MRTYLKQTEDEFIVTAELPGFSKDDLKVKITEDSVAISVDKKKIAIEKGKNFYREESSYGSMSEHFTLPLRVEANKSKIEFRNGILEIIIPKKKKVSLKK
ncbi:MAG TPA: Hsp20/alpha crystallin family protein [archaeon]|nr:Hsp20/alpha crystallin family protein [archaeon]